MLNQYAVDGEQRRLVGEAQNCEGDDPVSVEAPVAIGTFREESGDEDEQRHVEQVDDIEERAQRLVVVVDGVHEMRGDHQNDEQPLDVVEQRDALACASHVIPPIDEAVVASAILSQPSFARTTSMFSAGFRVVEEENGGKRRRGKKRVGL